MDRSRESAFVVETYERYPAVCVEYDPEAASVAAMVAEALCARMPSLRVEHVGSTAVPGCAGKGIVDIAVIYRTGELVAARGLVDSLGFQRQTTRDPFPEDRPMRVGALDRDGRKYCLHIHILSVESTETADMLAFRDGLRADGELREAYVACKRRLLAAGVTDSVDFSYAKGEFIRVWLNSR